MKKIFILRGEGIECEKEAFRFFSLAEFHLETIYVDVPKLLKTSLNEFFAGCSADDWIFFPGGFSFSDHFGSGRLLAHQLNSVGFFEQAIAHKVHLLGVCNGFQVLTQAELFGPGVSLEHNEVKGTQPIGFRNLWIHAKTSLDIGAKKHLRLCVRHGEGRLQVPAAGLPDHVTPFLFYDSDNFNNGSWNRVAGLKAVHGATTIWGMMPHPEVAWRMMDDPDFAGPDFNPANRALALEASGDGLTLMKAIFFATNSVRNGISNL